MPDTEAFYSNLYKENITDVDHRHAKRVFKRPNNKNLGDYHDFYVQSDTLLLTGVFENFRNKYIEIYEIDPAYFLSAPGLAWKACLGKVCHAIHRYAKANSKCVKNYDKSNESSYIQYLDANNLYGWAMSQKLPVGGFKRKKYAKIQ